jgi:hypothetical protein
MDLDDQAPCPWIEFHVHFHGPAFDLQKLALHDAPTPLCAGCLFSTHGLPFCRVSCFSGQDEEAHKAYIRARGNTLESKAFHETRIFAQ